MRHGAKWAGLLVVSAAGAAVLGCDVEIGESTLGELGRVDFSYTSRCLFGCSLERPLLPGTVGRISVSDAGDVAGLRASCAESEIATASVERTCWCERGGDGWAEGAPVEVDEACPADFSKRCDNVVELAAHGAGDTTLALYDPADGELIDRVTVLVREPHRAWFESGGVPVAAQTPIVLGVGRSDGVQVHLQDQQGRPLLVTGNVTWTISNPTVAGFPQWFGGPAHELVTDDIVSIEGLSAGDAKVSIHAGAFGITTPLHVAE